MVMALSEHQQEPMLSSSVVKCAASLIPTLILLIFIFVVVVVFTYFTLIFLN